MQLVLQRSRRTKRQIVVEVILCIFLTDGESVLQLMRDYCLHPVVYISRYGDRRVIRKVTLPRAEDG